MKKILIIPLVLITFLFNTYNVWAVDNKKINDTSSYYLKVDKILDKYFAKIDKKWEIKAKAIYKKVIVRIDDIIKKSKSEKKIKILNYIKDKFIEKINFKDKKEKEAINNLLWWEKTTSYKTNQKESSISDKSKVYRTDDNSSTATSHFDLSQDEAMAANARADDASTVTKDEIIIWGYTNYKDIMMDYFLDDLPRIDVLAKNLQSELEVIKYNKKGYSQNVINALKEDYKKTYELFTWWILNETATEWPLASHWFSIKEYAKYRISEWNELQQKFMRDIWYRLENWKLIYKDELNLLKTKYKLPKIY